MTGVADVALVVFDLDGTLIDSRRDLAESTSEMVTSYGAAPLAGDAVAAMVGDGARMLVARAIGAAGLDVDVSAALDRFLAIYDRRLLMHTRPYDGLAELVARLSPRVALAVLTNKPTAPARRILDAFDLSRHFRWVIGGDADLPRKPDPASLLFLMREASASAERTLMVGDSMVDVETGRRAGTQVCVAQYGYGRFRGEMPLHGDELVAATPVALVSVIEQMTSGVVLRKT